MSEIHRSAMVHHPGFLAYDFGPQHPLRPERISAGHALLQQAALWNPAEEQLIPEASTREELELVHDVSYIRAVQEGSDGWFPAGELRAFGLTEGDNPAFPGMHEASTLVTGGSVTATRRIMTGELHHAFNPAGGLHHALRARASGFCIYNDPAVAAAVAVREFGARVLYVDFDCHHGDGVQWLFYDNPNVLTISFHESGRFLFPGTGEVAERGEGAGTGFSVNVPFAPFTRDGSWMEAVRQVFPPLVQRFQPDLIISAHGADTHVWDPLTHLSLTTTSFVEQARLVHTLAHEFSAGRWLAVGSGGYDWRRVVPRSWAIVWCTMTDRELSDVLPVSWSARWSDGVEDMPDSFLDPVHVSLPTPREEEIDRVNRATVLSVMRLHGL
jgi:acetoin utilization protein AcuC